MPVMTQAKFHLNLLMVTLTFLVYGPSQTPPPPPPQVRRTIQQAGPDRVKSYRAAESYFDFYCNLHAVIYGQN